MVVSSQDVVPSLMLAGFNYLESFFVNMLLALIHPNFFQELGQPLRLKHAISLRCLFFAVKSLWPQALSIFSH